MDGTRSEHEAAPATLDPPVGPIAEQSKEIPPAIQQSPPSVPTVIAAEPEQDLALVDLPRDFDPDADPLPTPSHTAHEDAEDSLAVPIRSAEDEDAEEAAAEAAALDRRRAKEGQQAEGEGEGEEDGDDFRAILQSLAGNQGDAGGEADENEDGDGEGEAIVEQREDEPGIVLGEALGTPESAPQPEIVAEAAEDVPMESTFSSPLSDLPDLPNADISFSAPKPPTPPPRKRVLSPRPESQAESSASGAKRARVASADAARERDPDSGTCQPEVNGGRKEDKSKAEEGLVVNGKRARKQISNLEFDDLESISDGDMVSVKDSVIGKPKKSSNGKAKPAPRKKKVDGAFAGQSGAQPKSFRPKALTDVQLRKELKGKDRERQIGPCLRPRYTGWGKCTQCVGKVGGDSCRFKHFRMFKIDPDTAEILDTAEFEYTQLMEKMTPLPWEFNVPWTERDIFRTERTVASMLLPIISRELRHALNKKAVVREFDVAQHRSLCDFCSSTIFGGFFFCQKCGKDYCLQCERYFSDSMEAVRESPWDIPDAARPRLLRCTLAPPAKGTLAGQPPQVPSNQVEKVPMTVATDIVSTPPVRKSSSDTIGDSQQDLIAGNAGPESQNLQTARPDEVENTTAEATSVPNQDVSTSSQTNGEPAADTPVPSQRPLTPATYTPQKRSTNFHVRPDLVPVTRFHAKDLEEHWYKLVAFVLDGTGSLEERMKWLYPTHPGVDAEVDGGLSRKVDEYIKKHPTTFPPAPDPGLSDEEVSRYYAKSTNPGVDAIPDPAELRERSHPFIFVQAGDLDNELFDRLWARGEPIVVNQVGDRFKQTWTPDTFIERFGVEPCFVIDCQSEKIKETSVGKFFEMFKDPEQRTKGVWKLKDWPSAHDFQSAYPDLYNDFCDSLPVPDFTRREGVLNLYAHFPSGPTKPDIGPKMYNAFEGKESKGGQGSTRLHMDVADAINIMLYASPRSDGQPGCAVWDLFRAEDADTIREFLKRKYEGKVMFTDPIHSQVFYLDSELRKELADKYGVVSWRVYQYPGQAVFIPAGCAHQVCNLADCIKIALDFVSPHNVSRCQQLMHDFRKENYVKAWKDDVLQLYNVMWFAWLNARETRQRRIEEARAPIRPEPAATNGTNGISNDRIRFLSTQVSSVRDEPTQSPLQSRAPSPDPLEAVKDEREEDRSILSKTIFEAMLLQSDTPPPAPVDKKAEEADRERERDEKEREKERDPRMRTSELIKMGVLPVDVAVWGVMAEMKNEREEDGLGDLQEGGFSLGNV